MVVVGGFRVVDDALALALGGVHPVMPHKLLEVHVSGVVLVLVLHSVSGEKANTEQKQLGEGNVAETNGRKLTLRKSNETARELDQIPVGACLHPVGYIATAFSQHTKSHRM